MKTSHRALALALTLGITSSFFAGCGEDGVVGGDCALPYFACNGVCVDTSVDADNCGACGHVCGAGQQCLGNVCQGAAGSSGSAGKAGAGTSGSAGTGGAGKAGASGGSGKGGAGTGGASGAGSGGKAAGAGGAGGAGGNGGKAGAGAGSGGSAGNAGAGGAGNGGAAGSSGSGGAAGTAGVAGSAGASGTAGVSGSAGSSGSSGTGGDAGSAGVSGGAGSSGTAGATGGTAGSGGASGDAGAGGDAGTAGSGGDAGASGAGAAGAGASGAGAAGASGAGAGGAGAGGTGGSGGAPCTDCGSGCVDTQTDPLHCGGCPTACNAGFNCTLGVCVCPGGQTDCGGTCVDLTSDPDHCGACPTVCPTGVCALGVCKGATGGHAVLVGVDYANVSSNAVNRQDVRRLLGNAVFLGFSSGPWKVLSFDPFASPSAANATTIVTGQASLKGVSPLTIDTVTDAASALASLSTNAYQTFLVFDQPGATVGALGTDAASLAGTLTTFAKAGGNVVVLSGGTGTNEMWSFAAQTGFFPTTGFTQIAGSPSLDDIAMTSALGLGVASTFSSSPNTGTWTLVPAADTVVVIQATTGGGIVAVDKPVLP